MFETDIFIQEVKQRECLWNKYHPDHGSVLKRRTSWEEVGEIIYNDWSNMSSRRKDEKVLEMTKKWRNLRDYYKKENKKLEIDLKTPKRKRRNCGYFDRLSFLDANQGRRHRTSSNNRDEETTNHSDNESDSSYNDGQAQEETQEEDLANEKEEEIAIKIKEEMPTLKRPLQNVAQNQGRTQENEINSTGIKDFLMSLMPDVEMLDDQQYMNFRIGVLNLLSNIKFANNDHNESWVISTFSNNGV